MDETFKSRRDLYNNAWNRLWDILKERDALVADLARMANAAKDSHPAAGFVVDLDAERAHDLIDQIDAYRPRLTEAMQELNERGKGIGKPPVEWQI